MGSVLVRPKENFMKITSLLFMSFLLITMSNCKSAQDKCMLQGNCQSVGQTEGWLDENTFQIRAIGAPHAKAKRFVQRRNMAEEAALLSAQKRVIEKMLGASIKGACSSKDGEGQGCVIVKEFSGIVKGGSVVRKIFNENDDCEIYYRIQAKGLRKKAEAAVESLTETDS